MKVAGADIGIASTRGPDDEPVCEISFGPLQWYAPVEDVRQAAADMMACAAYADMMMALVARGLEPGLVTAIVTDLMSRAGRKMYGTPSTVSLLPAGSTKQKLAVVLFERGKVKQALTTADTRDEALAWLVVAHATEADQILSEALRATGTSEDEQDRLFGYMRSLRQVRDA